MPTMLRWLVIPPAIAAAWLLAILLALGLREVVIRFCPAEDMVSGLCMASWYRYVDGGIILGGAGIAAALILAVSVLLAPSHRVAVASVVLVGGVAAAFYMAYTLGLWGCFSVAVMAGVVTWFALLRWRNCP